MKRIYQVFAALCILAAVSAVNFKVTRGKSASSSSILIKKLCSDRFYDDYSYFHKPRSGNIMNLQFFLTNISDDESYDPFSDEFRFHSLYEDLPETNYSSLANELAVFLPKSEQEYFKIPIYVDKVIESLMEPHTRRNRYLELVSKANVFKKLGVYEELRNQTKLIPYKVVKNKNYCDEVDVLNLIYPSNLYHHHGVLDTYWRSIL